MSTKIEWVKNTDGTAGRTWNPVHGCTKISPGCQNCYAEKMAKRLQAMGNPGYEFGFEPYMSTSDTLQLPLKWKKPSKIFVCSMGDLFHEEIPDLAIGIVFEVMADCPQHTFQILTKRPERMRAMLKDLSPLPNAWLGVTAENQEQADKRIPILLDTPAAVRFVSVEPMLERVDLTYLAQEDHMLDALIGGAWDDENGDLTEDIKPGKLDWVICGGETGPGRRRMELDWARDLRDQCASAGVPFFFKKTGRRGESIPDDLMVRQWPEVAGIEVRDDSK